MIRAINTVFYIGLLRPAPGTWGSLAGLGLGYVILGLGQFPALALATLAISALGFWTVALGTRDSAEKDPAEIVIDEVAGIWLTLCIPAFLFWRIGIEGWDTPWPALVASFLFFRLFDIWKPGPIGTADRRGDAAGVMMDDLWAGLFAGACVVLTGGLWHWMML
jgi:phosphatidylglycerophosphatase A